MATLRSITLPMYGGLALGSLVALALVVESLRSGDELLRIYLLVGAAIGWLVGILAVPLNDDEQNRFGQFAKIIAGFLTGYLFSKIDPVVIWFVTPPDGGQFPIFDPTIQKRALFSFAGFLVSLIMIFNARSYWSLKASSATPKPAPRKPGAVS